MDCVKTRSHFSFIFKKCARETTFHIIYFKESPHIEDINALYKYGRLHWLMKKFIILKVVVNSTNNYEAYPPPFLVTILLSQGISKDMS